MEFGTNYDYKNRAAKSACRLTTDLVADYL